jgi:enoyl-CoA hydratase
MEALSSAVPVDALLGAFAEPAGTGRVMAAAIDRLLGGGGAEDILSRLDEEAAVGRPHAAFALATAAAIRTKSPTSLKIALAQMQRGASLDFVECMRTEFRIVSRVMRGHDFYEGVRAVIIDKDQTPRWQPATLEEVTPAKVEHYFAPLKSELELP